MKVIAIANQKGGVGKTTTAVNVAHILKKKGYDTLLIDTDQQCNSSDTFHAESEGVATIYDVIVEYDGNDGEGKKKLLPLDKAVQHTEFGDVVAGDRLLRDADFVLKNDSFYGNTRLKMALEAAKDRDFVIIDTNPTENSLLYNALVAADYVVVPLVAERYSLTGLDSFVETIESIKEVLNPKLQYGGFLFVRYDERRILDKNMADTLLNLSEQFGVGVFNTKIRDTVRVRESNTLRLPLLEYAPTCTASIDYEAFVEELLKKLGK